MKLLKKLMLFLLAVSMLTNSASIISVQAELQTVSSDDITSGDETEEVTLSNVALNKTAVCNPERIKVGRVVDGNNKYKYVTQNCTSSVYFETTLVSPKTDEAGYTYSDESYIIIDLGETHLIDSFIIYDFDREKGEREYAYTVSVCNDSEFSIAEQADASWTKVAQKNVGSKIACNEFELSDKVLARYVKIHDWKIKGVSNFTMNEVEVYGMEITDLDKVKSYAVGELRSYTNEAELDAGVQLGKDAFVSQYANRINNEETADAVLDILNEGLERMDAIISSSNLALGKNVVASSEHRTDLVASHAVDGDTTSSSSRWGSKSSADETTYDQTPWIYVDLGSEQKIQFVRTVWQYRKATAYRIQVSDDASNWTDIKVINDRPANKDDVIVFDAAVEARYVRLYIDSFERQDPDSTQSYPIITIYELEVYGEKQESSEDPDIPEIPSDELVNLALNRSVVASSEEATTTVAENAVDGDPVSGTSRWASAKGSGPHWIYVDFGTKRSFESARIVWQYRKATTYRIQISDDASNWTDIKVISGRPASKDDILVFDNVVSARYVRLYIDSLTSEDPDGGTAWNNAPVYEFEIYNGVYVDPLTYLSVETPNIGDEKLSVNIPEYPGYTITYNGTDFEQVVDDDLTIYAPVVDKKVKVSFKITSNANPLNYEFREFEVTVPGTNTKGAEDNAAPMIVPELAEWKGYTGKFTVAKEVKAVVENNDLLEMAKVFASDYEDLTGKPMTVMVGTKNDAKEGDFYFTLTADKIKGLMEEGYLMEIDDIVTVEAETATGSFWATRTILQALKSSGDNTIPKGLTRDYPLYKVRGFMLDVGRKTFKMDFLEQVVKQMSWYKMNDFQIHLNDTQPLTGFSGKEDVIKNAYSGFRLESEIKAGDTVTLNGKEYTYHADLTNKDVSYSKAEFKNFIEESEVYGVNIVPEIDTPSHSLCFAKVLPEFSLEATEESVFRPGSFNLDEYYSETLDFVTNVFDEYLLGENPAFGPAEVVHIGCDEYPYAAKATYQKYIKELSGHVGATDHTVRIWSSEYSDELDGTGMQGYVWQAGNYGENMYDNNYDLINIIGGRYYLVPNSGSYQDYFTPSKIYTSSLVNFGSFTIPAGDKQMLGGAFALWNDASGTFNTGISEYDCYVRFNGCIELLAANLWGKGEMTLDEATKAGDILGDAPNTNFGYKTEINENGIIADYTIDEIETMNGNNSIIETVDGKKALKLDGNSSYVVTGLETVGLGNRLTVLVKRTDSEQKDQILFESSYGSIKAVQGNTGKVGFSRENYDYSFNYELPVDEWVELTFENKYEIMKLYVNGQLTDVIGDDDNVQGPYNRIRPLKATCMFPVEKIGSETDAFIGYVASAAISESPENIVLGKVVTTEYSNNTNYPIKNVNDDKIGSYWSGGDYNNRPFFIVDLDGIYDLQSIELLTYYSDTRYYHYEIYTSMDGIDYKLYAEKNDDALSTALGTSHTCEEPVYAGYIKVVMTYNSANVGTHVNEIRAYGKLASEADYSKVEAAKAKVPSDLSLYTQESVKILNDALNAVEYGKSYTEQAAVDALAQAIEEAIANLKEIVFEIVKQPESVVAKKGMDASVTVEATGKGLTYTWYYKNPGNKKFYVSGDQFVSEDGASYTISMAAWRDGQEVYCVITDADGQTLQTNIVTLSMDNGSIKIVKQPEDVAVDVAGGEAVVTVEATGTDLTYQWYYKNPGNVKFYVSGDQFVSEDGATYTIPVAAWRDGQQVYCVITDANGISVQTNTVTLSVAK